MTLAMLVWLSARGVAAAHGLDASRTGWTFDPWIMTPLLAFGALYVAGITRLWRRSARARRWLAWRGAAGVAGWMALAGALVSPLHALGEQMFTFHMIEHEILMAVAAPLLVAARPLAGVLWGLPASAGRAAHSIVAAKPARALWGWLTQGATATVLHAVAIWGWHVPVLFDAAVTNPFLHRLQHLSFFLTAVLFWWSVLWRSGRGVATWHLFATMMHTAVLGALMALAPRVLYKVQTQAATSWGMTPLEDQQLAGILMWIPAGTIYAGAALAMAALWINQSRRDFQVPDHAHP